MRSHDFRKNDVTYNHVRLAPGLRGIRLHGFAKKKDADWSATPFLASWTYAITDDEWEALLVSPSRIDMRFFPTRLIPPAGGPPYVGSNKEAVPIWWSPGTEGDGFINRTLSEQLALVYTANVNDWLISEWYIRQSWAVRKLEEVSNAGKVKSVQVGIALPGPSKIAPALPAESNTLFPDAFKPFNAACAWKATRIAAGDPEK